MHRRVLDIVEKITGADRPEVADALMDLASMYRAQHNLSQAEPLFLKALAILEKSSGPASPHILAIWGHLASLYLEKGEYDRAEQFCERSLAVSEKMFGPEHGSETAILNTLAEVHGAPCRICSGRSVIAALPDHFRKDLWSGSPGNG